MDRRSFIRGLLAMPAIVRPGLIMPVRPIPDEILPYGRMVMIDIEDFRLMFDFNKIATETFNLCTMPKYWRKFNQGQEIT